MARVIIGVDPHKSSATIEVSGDPELSRPRSPEPEPTVPEGTSRGAKVRETG